MTGLKRHPALQDFSRDHQRFLTEARNVRWALDGDEHAQPFETVVRSLVEFWNHDGVLHIREEEEVLLPLAFNDNIGSQPYVIRVVGDHMWLRDRISKIEAQLESVVDRKLLRTIAERISEHIRFEERVLFEFIQNQLKEEELDAIQEQSLAFRLKWRP
ncbi:MAG: hypothetical protein OHK0046_02090 [Anaerolineae bacterium]